uniref:Uncharacterized protein n=1 Tax=Anguilla anguilla TaxID=7936 RepID=A0A0E9TT78_ANGAN
MGSTWTYKIRNHYVLITELLF